MLFRPNVGDTLSINDTAFHVAAHPTTRSVPYGLEGRQANIYQLRANNAY